MKATVLNKQLCAWTLVELRFSKLFFATLVAFQNQALFEVCTGGLKAMEVPALNFESNESTLGIFRINSLGLFSLRV